jgi:hypothetical protein
MRNLSMTRRMEEARRNAHAVVDLIDDMNDGIHDVLKMLDEMHSSDQLSYDVYSTLHDAVDGIGL